MIHEFGGIAWSELSHAYGQADDVPGWLADMASADAKIRGEALSSFVSAVHHQGGVYDSTIASLPFLFALADDPVMPDRASIVGLLVSIGQHALDGEGLGYVDSGHDQCARAFRARSAAFLAYAADNERGVRHRAIEGLGLFVDDADLAVAALRERLLAEDGSAERLVVVAAMATLALRLLEACEPVTLWLKALSHDTTVEPEVRLAALVHAVRVAPGLLDSTTVPTAIGLLREISHPVSGPRPKCACTASKDEQQQDAPPEIVAAFEDLDRWGRLHALTTPLLRTFHEFLDARVSDRTALLAEQLTSPHQGSRHDAIRMARELISTWRGDHSRLIGLLADLVDPDTPDTTAESAETLAALAPLTEPARPALVAYVTAQTPDAWTHPDPRSRRAYQQSVLALATLNDPAALPPLLTALDGDTDAWRAVQASRHLPEAAADLLPRLTRRLYRADLSTEWSDMSTNALISALSRLGDPAAVPVLVHIATTAADHRSCHLTAYALNALASFGSAAAPALPLIHSLTTADDPAVRASAASALWAITTAPAVPVAILTALLESHAQREAAEALGRIGTPAAPAIPLLRTMLTASYDWTRIHAAAAIWDITADPTVLSILLTAWDENPATAVFVLACLTRMGPAAAPALPRLREELARPHRSDSFLHDVSRDESVQHACRTLLASLSSSSVKERLESIMISVKPDGEAV
ncbi:hypothetical protein [Actinocorallia aurantiaca]